VGITDITSGIHNAIQRHASPLEEIYFLSVHSCNRMIGIRQANKWNFFILPILLECRTCIRTYCQDHRVTICEFFVLITQARQLRAAVGSHKTSQEHEHHGSSLKIGQMSVIALYIFKFEIRSKFPRGNEFTHFGAILLFSPKFRQTSSLLIFLSMYFAGSGDKNKESIRHSPVDRPLHEHI
jgi:hypothetical protein